MLDTLAVLPGVFWIVMVLLAAGFFWSMKNVKRGAGIPAAMVLGTIAVWYVGDALYNDYREIHMWLFSPELLTEAWWQVVVFLAVFLLLTPLFHKRINGRYLGYGSKVAQFLKKGISNPQFQHGLTTLFRVGLLVWFFLLIGAVFRFQEDFFYYLFPFFGKHSGPWTTSGIGGGVSTLYALANYLQLMIGALFGVIAALSTDTRIRRISLLIILLTWPHYIFHRTRKFILVVAIPGILAWVFLRIRGGMLKKITLIVAFFLLVNAWFGFVIGHRGGVSVSAAFMEESFDFSRSTRERHQGLNMYEELSWILMLTTSGRYNPNAGENYFANLVNPIPRSFWASKPTIGLDYAIVRGMGGANTTAGVYATFSNGLIGQGVVNFGPYFGPAFAAMLMSLWVCWLARLDLCGEKIGYLPLYGLGLILTFTMGRDITFLELYPFVFGYVICWWLNRRLARRRRRRNNNLSSGTHISNP